MCIGILYIHDSIDTINSLVFRSGKGESPEHVEFDWLMRSNPERYKKKKVERTKIRPEPLALSDAFRSTASIILKFTIEVLGLSPLWPFGARKRLRTGSMSMTIMLLDLYR
jgi:hypothetical protein